MIVPLSMFPQKNLVKMSKLFRGLAKLFSNAMPSVDKTLKKMDSEISGIEYFSIGFFNSLLLSTLMFALFLALGYLSGQSAVVVALVAFIAALAIQFVFFSFLFIYPRILFEQKKQRLERSLPFALRYLMVQVSSGVPLFNAIADIASTKKNEVAYEFGKIIRLTQTGMGLTQALEENAAKNPSHFYKMAILQIANSSRSGTDIAKAIGEIINAITKDQRISMKIYSSQLNILTMIYMILTIILPTLGIVMLVILSNFVSLILSLPLYILLLVVLALIQFLFVGLIESKRPIVAV